MLRDEFRNELEEIPAYEAPPACTCGAVVAGGGDNQQIVKKNIDVTGVFCSSMRCLYTLGGVISPQNKQKKRATSPSTELPRKKSFQKIDHYATTDEQHEYNDRVPLVSDSDSDEEWDEEWACPSHEIDAARFLPACLP